jgi:hypothetical protein
MPASDFYHQNQILVQAKTQVRCFQPIVNLSSATVLTTNPNLVFKAVSAVPANDLANGRLVIRSEGMNYLKVIPYFSSTQAFTGPAMRIVGWNADDTGLVPPTNQSIAARMWHPQQLCHVSLTLNAATANYANVSMNAAQGVDSMALLAGDAKLYNANSGAGNGGGFLVVDTMGCEYIEFIFSVATKSGIVNANGVWQSL